MKKSIAFLLASLAASSLLFHTTEANAFKKKKGTFIECRTGKDLFVLEKGSGNFQIFKYAKGKREYLYGGQNEKKATKQFEELCKSGKSKKVKKKVNRREIKEKMANPKAKKERRRERGLERQQERWQEQRITQRKGVARRRRQ